MGARVRAAVGCATAPALTTGLAACGSGSSGSGGGGSEVTIWHGYTDAEATSIRKLGDEWNVQHPDQKVDLVFDGGSDNVLQKTIAGFTAGNYPDVAYEFGSSLAPLSKQPKLVDLTEKVKDPSVNWDDFFPAVKQAATVDGKVVAMPALVDNLALVYNKKLFKAAGIAPPTADWTWQDFRNAAKKLTDPSKKQFGWAYVNDGTEDTVWRYLAMLWQAGGDLLNSDNTKPAFDSPAGLAALQQLKDMAVTDKSVYLDSGNQNYSNLFAGGRIGMLWTGPWDLGSFDQVDYGVAELPGYNGNHETIAGPDMYVLFNHSDTKSDNAFKFLTWLTSAKVHLQFAIDTGDLPLRQSETELPDYSKVYLKEHPNSKVFTDNLNNVKHTRPNIASYGEVSSAIGEMVQSVLLGQAAPPAARDAARDQVTGVLAGS